MSHPLSQASRPIRDLDDVADLVAATAWAPSTEDRLGLEVEAFPLLVEDGRPHGRLPLFDGDVNVVGVVAEVAASSDAIQSRDDEKLAFPSRFGGAVTFEPGGQLEYSTAPATTTACLRAELDEVWGWVLELRAVDGLPRRWWMVPLVLTGGVLYDPQARDEVIELLEPHGHELDNLWRRAARHGLADREIAGLAGNFVIIALEGARRHSVMFDDESVADAASFVEEFTLRGLSPSDALDELLYDSAAALAWTAPEHTMRGAA